VLRYQLGADMMTWRSVAWPSPSPPAIASGPGGDFTGASGSGSPAAAPYAVDDAQIEL